MTSETRTVFSRRVKVITLFNCNNWIELPKKFRFLSKWFVWTTVALNEYKSNSYTSHRKCWGCVSQRGPYDEKQLYANHNRRDGFVTPHLWVTQHWTRERWWRDAGLTGEHPESSVEWTGAPPLLDQTLQGAQTLHIMLHRCSLHSNIQLLSSGSPSDDVSIFSLSSVHISSWSLYYKNMKSNKVLNKICLVIVFVYVAPPTGELRETHENRAQTGCLHPILYRNREHTLQRSTAHHRSHINSPFTPTLTLTPRDRHVQTQWEHANVSKKGLWFLMDLLTVGRLSTDPMCHLFTMIYFYSFYFYLKMCPWLALLICSSSKGV